MEKTAKVTALCNQKGGVGKTATAVNLGIGLARDGKRVLLVDCDPQGSLTASLDYQHPDQMENTLADVMSRIISNEPQIPGNGIIRHAEGVDLLPGIVRPRREGGYEIVAGHRRKRGCELAGRDTMPVIVRDMDDDEASGHPDRP